MSVGNKNIKFIAYAIHHIVRNYTLRSEKWRVLGKLTFWTFSGNGIFILNKHSASLFYNKTMTLANWRNLFPEITDSVSVTWCILISVFFLLWHFFYLEDS